MTTSYDNQGWKAVDEGGRTSYYHESGAYIFEIEGLFTLTDDYSGMRMTFKSLEAAKAAIQ